MPQLLVQQQQLDERLSTLGSRFYQLRKRRHFPLFLVALTPARDGDLALQAARVRSIPATESPCD